MPLNNPPVTIPTRHVAAYNYETASNTYKIGIAKSDDGRTFKRVLEPAISAGTGFESSQVKDPSLIQAGGLYYCYYSGYDGSVFKIGLATSPDGVVWTKSGSNPVLTIGQAWENSTNNEVHTPVVIYDEAETDANKKYKMWYAGGQFGAGGIGYAYSADGVSWTKYASNPVVSLGSAAQWDDAYVLPGSVVRVGDVYYLFYNGNNGSGTWQGGLATFTNPESTYTKSSANPVLASDANSTSIDANVGLNATQVTVGDTSVHDIGAPVWVGDGTNRYMTRIKSQVSATVFEMHDPAPIAIGLGGVVRSLAYNSVTIESVVYDGAWWVYFTAFQPGSPMNTGLVHETAMMAYGKLPTSLTIDYSAGVVIPFSTAESATADSISFENPSVVDTWKGVSRYTPGNIPFCSVTHSTTQSIPTGAWTPLVFDTDESDATGMHDTVSNTSRITILIPGIYDLSATAAFASAANGLRGGRFLLNGTTSFGRVSYRATASATDDHVNLSRKRRFATGDYIEIAAYQDTGGALNAANTVEFQAVWVGP